MDCRYASPKFSPIQSADYITDDVSFEVIQKDKLEDSNFMHLSDNSGCCMKDTENKNNSSFEHDSTPDNKTKSEVVKNDCVTETPKMTESTCSKIYSSHRTPSSTLSSGQFSSSPIKSRFSSGENEICDVDTPTKLSKSPPVSPILWHTRSMLQNFITQKNSQSSCATNLSTVMSQCSSTNCSVIMDECNTQDSYNDINMHEKDEKPYCDKFTNIDNDNANIGDDEHFYRSNSYPSSTIAMDTDSQTFIEVSKIFIKIFFCLYLILRSSETLFAKKISNLITYFKLILNKIRFLIFIYSNCTCNC